MVSPLPHGEAKGFHGHSLSSWRNVSLTNKQIRLGVSAAPRPCVTGQEGHQRMKLMAAELMRSTV